MNESPKPGPSEGSESPWAVALSYLPTDADSNDANGSNRQAPSAEQATADPSSEDSASKEAVVLVHGTFASEESDHGDAWWQQGSRCWRALSGLLGKRVRVASGDEVFHWSGKNSERARIQAGRQLLEQVSRYEKEDRSYHLIGHSHGGSVIWHALREATRRGHNLKGLRSWSTVGTPFLHFRTKGSPWVGNLLNLLLAVTLLRPALWTFERTIQVITAGLTNTPIERSGREMPALIQIMDAPMILMFEMLGVPVARTENGLRIGSWSPENGDHLGQYLFGTWEGWVLIIVSLLYVYVLLNLVVFFLSPVVEWGRLRSETRLEKRVAKRYSNRWLGLWSREDEAIGGLRATMQLSMTFVSKIVPQERVLWSDNLGLVARPYQWVWMPTFNRLLRPVLDRSIRSIVIKRAQGNNRPAAEIVDVSTIPFCDRSADQFPALPEALDRQIIDRVNEHSHDLAPKLRRMLSENSVMQGLENLTPELSGSELVHTSYFDHDAIVKLLAAHIQSASSVSSAEEQILAKEEVLADWLGQFKRTLENESEPDEVAPGIGDRIDDGHSVDEPLHGIRPRRTPTRSTKRMPKSDQRAA